MYKNGNDTTKEEVSDLKKTVFDFLMITIGAFLLALSLNLFLIPNKISSGGISSVGTILFYLYKIPLSVTNLALNAVLFLFGYRFLGKTAIIKTIIGIFLLSLFLELTNGFSGISNDLTLASLFGGAVMGLGIGLVVRYGASTGGSDFAGMVLHRILPHISVATHIMIIDSVIVLIAGVIFRDIAIMLYSFLTLVVSTKVILFVLGFGDVARAIVIISRKNEVISKAILSEFSRGVTGIHSRGMYSQNEQMVLLCVVAPKELPKVVRRVRELDRGAFLIINDSRAVLGEGFKQDEMY